MYHIQLRIFIQVADCGSFSKAGEKLFLSPTAVMKHMNQLEDRVGTPLLKRSNHGISLTLAGESIYKDAKFIINYSSMAIRQARRLGASSSFLIRVGTSFLNPCKQLMELWARVSDKYPQFKIRIIPFEDDHNSILSTIDDLGADFDFIVGACDSEEWLKRSKFFPLGKYRFCCAVSRQHRLARREELAWTDLYGERLMMVRRGDSPSNDAVRDMLEKEHPGILIEDVFCFYDMEVFNRCEQTGAVLLTLDGWSELHPSLKTIPLRGSGTVPYGLLYPKSPSKDVREFLKAVSMIKAE